MSKVLRIPGFSLHDADRLLAVAARNGVKESLAVAGKWAIIQFINQQEEKVLQLESIEGVYLPRPERP